jgi:hypothetical protein
MIILVYRTIENVINMNFLNDMGNYINDMGNYINILRSWGDVMKIKIRYILLMGVIIIVLGMLELKIIPKNARETVGAVLESQSSDELKIIKASNVLRPGDVGAITIQGSAGKKYTIKSSYRKENKNISVTQERTADEYGQVTFVWSVSKETAPGTYPVTIIGGGKTITLNHIVLK